MKQQAHKEVKNHRPVYFVEVQDHITLRRHILQSLRDILDSLQKFHDFTRMKEQKAKKILELRGMVNRTSALIWTLKDTLPHMNVPAPKKQKKAKILEEASPAAPEPVKQPRQRSELDMLEDELASIERKLNKLA